MSPPPTDDATSAAHRALLPPGLRDLLPPDAAHEAAVVEALQVVGQADEEAQFLQAEVGACQMAGAAFGVGGLHESLQYVERRALQAVAEEEFSRTREAIHHRNQPAF